MDANGENTPGLPGYYTPGPGRVRVNDMIVGQSYICISIDTTTGRPSTGHPYTVLFTGINHDGEIVNSHASSSSPRSRIYFNPGTPVDAITGAVVPIENGSVLNQFEIDYIREAKESAAGGAGGRPRRGGRRRSTRRSRSRNNRKNRSRKH